MTRKTTLALVALLSLPTAAFADSSLCDSNLANIEDFLRTASHDATGVKVNAVHGYKEKAEQARADGNYAECVNQSEQALRVIHKPANR